MSAPSVQPPAFHAIPTQSVTAGETLSFNVGADAYDPNSPALPLTLGLGANPPSGASITAAGVLTWVVPSSLTPGTYSVPIVATDNGTPQQSADATVSVNMLSVEAPSLLAFDPLVIDAGTTLSQNVRQAATDENTPSLPIVYSIASGPTGARIDPSSGLLTWAIPSDQPNGTVPIVIAVSDILTTANPTERTLSVERPAPAQSPVVSTISVQNGTADQRLPARPSAITRPIRILRP